MPIKKSEYLSEILNRLSTEQIFRLQEQLQSTGDGINKISEDIEILKLDVKKGTNPIKDIDSEISKISKKFVEYSLPYYKNLYQLACPILGIEKSREFIVSLIEDFLIETNLNYNPKKEILKNLNFS